VSPADPAPGGRAEAPVDGAEFADGLSDVTAADLGVDAEGDAPVGPEGDHGPGLEIELEVEHPEDGLDDPALAELPVGDDLRRLVEVAAASAGVTDGHVAITIVDPEAIHELNLEHRGKDKPTDVLSFPIDGAGPVAGPREIGDVVICPEHTVSLREAVVHGILHLVGFDHETDHGEMLAVQAQILDWLPGDPPATRGMA
jgi:probable rRNA maturation factor